MEQVLGFCKSAVETAVDVVLDVIGRAITFVAKILTDLAERAKEKARAKNWDKEKAALRPVLCIVLAVSSVIAVLSAVCCILGRKK